VVVMKYLLKVFVHFAHLLNLLPNINQMLKSKNKSAKPTLLQSQNTRLAQKKKTRKMLKARNLLVKKTERMLSFLVKLSQMQKSKKNLLHSAKSSRLMM